jgi:hypothetical protein
LRAGQRPKLFAAMRLDKKVSGGEIKFVLAKKIGRVEFGHKVPAILIDQALNLSAFASGSSATAPKRSEGGQPSTLN